MWYASLVFVVFWLWKLLGLIDEVGLDGRLVRAVGRVAAVGAGLVAMFNPPAFAEGTKQYVDASSKALVSWFVESLVDVLPDSPTPEPPPTSTLP